MNKLITVLILLFWAFSFTACSKDSCTCDSVNTLPDKFNAVTFEPSMKGWELYSWPANGENCHWKYTLLQGSNRIKSYNEVTSDTSLIVVGEQQLKLLLNKLPVDEEISWLGKTWLAKVWGAGNIDHGNLSLPGAAAIDEIKQHCIQRGLNLTVLQ